MGILSSVRSNWRRTALATLSAAAIVASTLAIPVSAQTTPTITAAKCAAPGSLTMQVWDEAWAKAINTSIEKWKADYCPGAEVTLNVVPWGDYWTGLRTSIAGGDAPDIFNVSQPNFFFFASNNALLNLQPYFDTAQIDTTIWGSGMVDPYRWGETRDLYAGPVNWDTVVVFYNKDMFEAAGVALPTKDWTWDDFSAAAEKLTNTEADVYGAAVYSEYQSGYPNWIASTDTSPIVTADKTTCTLTEPGSLEALNYLKGLLDKGYMPSPSVLGGTSADDSFNFWASGKVAMVTNGSWKLSSVADIPFNWDVVQLPKNPTTGISRSILHSVGYAASASTENPDLAANLIVYLLSDEGAKFFADAAGVAPANPNEALQTAWVTSLKSDKNIAAFVDATADSQGITAYDEIWDKVNTELVVKIFDQGESVESVTKEVCDFVAANPPPTTVAQ